MPWMYTVPAGAGQAQLLSGTPITFCEIQTIFRDHPPLWLGEGPPTLSAMLRWTEDQVLIAVRADEGVNPTFDRPGFYRLPDLSPGRATEMLSEAQVGLRSGELRTA